jgi:glutamate-1-semialdehyde 2,1-aminomutase/neamine transaminase/2'-deamino-2'-hydroxyneamine transaminase/neomycin C transaminase
LPDRADADISTRARSQSPALARARELTASDTWDLDRRFPIVMDRASGAHVLDDTGAEYVDLTSCSGAAPLGAGYPEVIEAIVAELRRSGGILPGPLSVLRVDLAGRLAAIFPCAQRSVFFRTGSCATTAAVRLARVHTGRRVVLTSGFHGWHDWHLQYRPQLALPDRDPDTFDFGYDLARLDELARSRGDVAAVIFTPEVSVYPAEYARELAGIVRRHGALLVVDEVMTGFRYGWGGYHGAAGISPDLITLSKGLANGTALSCVAGRAEVMRAAERTYLGNTFQRETTPFAAALATLDAMETGAPLRRIHAAGQRLMAGLDAIFIETGTGAWVSGSPAMFDMIFEDPARGTGFCQRMWSLGYLMQYGGRFMPSAAITDDDVDQFLQAARAARPEAAAASRPGPHPAGHRDDARYLPAAIAFARENFGATEQSVRRWARLRRGGAGSPS